MACEPCVQKSRTEIITSPDERLTGDPGWIGTSNPRNRICCSKILTASNVALFPHEREKCKKPQIAQFLAVTNANERYGSHYRARRFPEKIPLRLQSDHVASL
jgi:hypothetical protein